MSSGSQSYGDSTSDHEDIRHFLRSVQIELEKLESNTKIYLTNVDLQQHQQDSRLKKGIDVLKAELETLTEGVHFILGPFWQNINDEMFDLNNAAQKQKVIATEYKAQCENQEEIIKNLEEKVEKLEITIREQNSFLSSMGSTLAGLLWKGSKSSELTKSLMDSSKIGGLFDITSDVLKSFFEVYDRKMPPTKSDEVQFVISLVGIIVNITALPEGRQFVVETPEGQAVMKYLVRYVAKFSDSSVQRLMLMAIFNISIHKNGTKLVLHERCLFTLLKTNISGRGVAMRYIALKLLQAITYHTDDATHLSILFEEIPVITLNEAEEESSEEERDLIHKIRQRYWKLQNVATAKGLNKTN